MVKNLTPGQILTWLVYGIVGILAILVGFKLSTKIVGGDPITDQGESETAKSTAIADIKVNKSSLPKDASRYRSIADSIYSLLLGHWQFSWGEKEFTEIKALLNVLMPSELVQVYKDFGLRQATNFNISAGRSYSMIEAIELRFGVNGEYTKQLKPIFKNTNPKLWQ